MTRIFILHNPVSGTHQADSTEETIRTHFRQTGWECQIHRTEKGEDLAAIVSKAAEDGIEVFAPAGGDGTVNAAASGLLGTGLPLGVLPLGTGNGLATFMGIPLQLEPALKLITAEHTVRRIDALEFNGRHALLNISAGVSPQAMKLSKRQQKRRLGAFAYYLAGIRALAGIQPVNFEVEIDGEYHFFQASEILALNTVNIGSSRRFLDLEIENDDGVLDVFIIRSKTAGAYVRILANVLLRRTQEEPELERYAVRDRMMVRTARSVLVQADGDLIGETPIEVRIRPQAVNLIVPQD